MTCLSLTLEPYRTIGFRFWKEQPFAHSYLGIGGAKGRFLGFWAVLMQASFSFFGSEVPGIVRFCSHFVSRAPIDTLTRRQGK